MSAHRALPTIRADESLRPWFMRIVANQAKNCRRSRWRCDAPSATFPESLDFGPATTASDAAARTGLPVPVVPSLAAPAGIFVVSPPDSGQIVVVYPPSASLPESAVGSVGALVSSMPGIINDGLFLKTQSAATTVVTFTFQTTAGHTVHAVWLAGTPHDYVFQDRDGNLVFDTLRLATNTLLWQDGDVTYRLERFCSWNAIIDSVQYHERTAHSLLRVDGRAASISASSGDLLHGARVISVGSLCRRCRRSRAL